MQQMINVKNELNRELERLDAAINKLAAIA